MADTPRRRRIRTSTIITVISMSMVLFLVGLLGIFLISAKKISDHLKENIGFHIYLKDQATDEQAERLEHHLRSAGYVKSFHFLSKDSAAAIYKKDVGEDFVQFIGYNPLPSSFEVQLKADYANPDSIAMIKEQVVEFSAVREFDYQVSLVDMVNKNVNRIILFLLSIILLLLLIAIALINNTIRLAIYSSRFVIRTMQLVGATGGFIRKPFLIESLRQGLIAGIIACGLIWGMIAAATRKIPDLSEITDTELMFMLTVCLIALGLLISTTSTLLSVRKYLRSNTEELYY